MNDLINRKIPVETLLERARRLNGHAKIYDDGTHFALICMVLDVDPDPAETLQVIYDKVSDGGSDAEIAALVKERYAKLLDIVEDL